MRLTPYWIPFVPGLVVIPPHSLPACYLNGPVAQDAVAADTTSFPQFSRMVLLERTSETSANVSIGDLNADGHLDIVLAKGRHWPLVNRVLLGDGHGGFPLAHDLGEASDRSYSGRLVDIDGDGDLDVVISNDRPDPKRVYLNDGAGDFRVGSTYGRPEWSTRNASVADLNGDGLPDIVVANRGGPSYVCLNLGEGQFAVDCAAFSTGSATTITAADFDGDGLIDLVVPHRDGGQSYVYVNAGDAGFSDGERVAFGPPNAAIRMAEATDLDGDGLLDIVAIDQQHGVAVYFGQSDSMFSPGVAVGDTSLVPYALAGGDLNLDGTIDIIVGHVEAPSRVYFNDGSGRHFTPVEFGDDQGVAYGFAIADLDRDGGPDIAVARSGAPNVVYFADPRPTEGR